MGILLRDKKTKKVQFFLKGADNIMMTKLSENEKIFVGEEAEVLSREGFRTLVFAAKSLSESELVVFEKDFKAAELDMKNRENREEECVMELETNMHLLGVSGVEDLLQENVKDCIVHLREAEIKGDFIYLYIWLCALYIFVLYL